MTLSQVPATTPRAIEDARLDTTLYGFWLYLMSDCILFATVFVAFSVLSREFAAGPSGREIFQLDLVFIETLLLLTSSLTQGLAISAQSLRKTAQTLAWQATTFCLGAGFIGLEISEFRQLVMAGNGPQRSAFLSAFFGLVGLHGLHVSVGLLWMLSLMARLAQQGFTANNRSNLLRLALFWHFLDIVWVGVFTVVYLAGAL